MKFVVRLTVDGVDHEEEINAPSVELAINKAKKLHPTLVTAVIPLEVQMAIDEEGPRPEDHPGQTRVDDQGVPTDAGMEAIGDALSGGSAGPAPAFSPEDAEAELAAVADEGDDPDGLDS